MTNKKIIYGIEFEAVASQHNKGTLTSNGFTIMFISFDSGKALLNVVFSNPTTSFHVERNTISDTFFEFFSLCPNLIKTKEFHDISSTFFENYKKELDDKINRITFDDFDKTLPPLPDIENIDVSQIESKECVIRRNNK